jgi:hypothetical protein
MLTRMAKRSDQEITLRRRPALATASLRLPWISRIDGLRGVAEVLQNPLDSGDTAKRAERVGCQFLNHY